MKTISKLLMLSFLLLSLGMLSGCGTVNGFGHDVSTVGHGISRAAS
ncbi:MAG: entericidin A/B family lipoprotein [Gammaproteobacteria bacterium]